MGVAFKPTLENGDYSSWSYSGFNAFRDRIKESKLTLKYFDKLEIFFNHSDCDGYLTVSQCKKLVPLLREIIQSWPNVSENEDIDFCYDKQMGLMLIKQMEFCINSGQKLKFA